MSDPVASDKQLGISIRFIREFDIKADTGFDLPLTKIRREMRFLAEAESDVMTEDDVRLLKTRLRAWATEIAKFTLRLP